MTKQIQPVPIPAQQRRQLEADLAAARQELQKAEAALASEQAAVNAFRLHCRLKLDQLVDEYQALQVEKQALLTQWSLEHEADPDPFWQDGYPFEAADEQEPLLPTDVPLDKAAEKRLYRQLARQFHPDLGRTAVEIAYRTDMMAAVNNAYHKGDVGALYALAGELDPAAAAELAAMTNTAARKLRQTILNCQRRKRKVQQQLHSLRQENTARLWRKAQALDEAGTDWWEIVRREITAAIEQRQAEIMWLRQRVSRETATEED